MRLESTCCRCRFQLSTPNRRHTMLGKCMASGGKSTPSSDLATNSEVQAIISTSRNNTLRTQMCWHPVELCSSGQKAAQRQQHPRFRLARQCTRHWPQSRCDSGTCTQAHDREPDNCAERNRALVAWQGLPPTCAPWRDNIQLHSTCAVVLISPTFSRTAQQCSLSASEAPHEGPACVGAQQSHPELRATRLVPQPVQFRYPFLAVEWFPLG